MAVKKLDEYIFKAFKDLGFSEDEITKGCWLLERTFKYTENGKEKEELRPVAWIALHKFLERAAQMAGIIFDEPKIFNLQPDEIALYVNGKKGDFSAWAIGEASSLNLTKTSKAYRWAMAEKRAKDRVILKLLGIAGDMYSEEEADEFKEKKPEKNDFEKSATADKRATTLAVKKALSTGATELPQRTEEKLKADFTTTLQHLVNVKSFKNLNNTQIDFINRLLKELHDRGFEQQYEQISTLYMKLQQEDLDDSINI